MRLVVNFLGGLLAIGWAAVAADYAGGARRSRTLESQPPFAGDEVAPSLSVVLAACNEEAKFAAAFRTLLTQEYPGPLQIVAVDDRSTDGTPGIMDGFTADPALRARSDRTLVVLHLKALPPGWLGKNHALYQGAARATGDWLLFTDADILFGATALSRAVRYAEAERRDHLVAFFGLELNGFWENLFGLCFNVLFFLRFRPWHVSDPRRPQYLGVGGFNLVRRSAYDAVGTHRAIALEVADDMELGHRIKQGGFSSEVVGAKDLVRVRWQDGGLPGLMNGLTKNAYAGLDYSPVVVLRSVALLLVTVVWPPIGILAARSRAARLAYAFCTAMLGAIGINQARNGGIPPLYGLTLPFSSLLLIAVMIRSAFHTERQGGITWRGTFYDLPMLRARSIPAPPPLQG